MPTLAKQAPIEKQISTVNGDNIGGDKTTIGNISDTKGVAVGQGATAVHIDALGAVGDVITGTKISLVNQQTKQRVASNRQSSAPPDIYVSRKEAEKELKALLTDDKDKYRSVNLYGLPGVGKSWLARKVVSDLEDVFDDGTLWGNLKETNLRTVLWNFIEPFNNEISRSSLTSISEYVAALERALGNKRVLIVLDQIENQPDLNLLLPDQCQNCMFLLISRNPPPAKKDFEESYHLLSMNEKEAVKLFSRQLRQEDNTSDFNESYIQKLVKKLDYNPAALNAVANDMNINMQTPEDYLESLETGRYEGMTSNIHLPGLETVFDHLPTAGKELFPFLSVLNEAPWSDDVLITVSRMSSDDVADGLAQLLRAGLVKKQASGYYQVENTIGSLAFNKLTENAGDQIFNMGLALRASDLIRKGEIMLRYMRQTLLGASLENEEYRSQASNMMLKNLENFKPLAFEESERGKLISIPIDPLQDFFENILLKNESYVEQWLDMLLSSNFSAIRRQLDDVFDWSLGSGDWPLVRRFALRIGVNTTWIMDKSFTGNIEGDNHVLFDILFGLVKNVEVIDAEVDRVSLKATRMKLTTWKNCQFIALNWPGVHIISATFKKIDMVGMRMPGAIVTACEFTDVDARHSDFRGVIFQQCSFQNVNFRGARLDHSKFINCIFENVDFRSTTLEKDFLAKH